MHAYAVLVLGAIDVLMADCFNRNGVVRLLTELVASHVHHKTLVFKLCNLMFFITYDNKGFRTDELYLGGRGPVVLFQVMSCVALFCLADFVGL